ncbi:MAG TPA: hypothetical protein VGH27_13435 [Streptosporangiaceae bacterium]|jgi:hypothetical protein
MAPKVSGIDPGQRQLNGTQTSGRVKGHTAGRDLLPLAEQE